MSPLSVATRLKVAKARKQEPPRIRAGVTQLRADNTRFCLPQQIVILGRVGYPYTELASHESHQPLTYQESS